jgi:CMP-N-acetylneuraminic acid synthetase
MTEKPEVLGIVLARGGSKGVPRKNMCLVGGKPLLYWSFQAAKSSKLLTRTLFSTDDPEMATYARSEQVEVPFMRPVELATDSASAINVTLHALKWLEEQEGYRPDYVVLLQPTSPLRTAADIDACIQLAVERSADGVVSVMHCPAHPYLMRTIDDQEVLHPFINTPLSAGQKQQLPTVYSLNGAVYVARRTVLQETRTWHPAGALAYVMPDERSLDVDTHWDLKLVDLVLRG